MQKASEHGVYEAEQTEELARVGRAYATIDLCQCGDGFYRYALDMAYSTGGFRGPIFRSQKGFDTYSAAKEVGTRELLERFPKAWVSVPHGVYAELRELRTEIEAVIRQPSLF